MNDEIIKRIIANKTNSTQKTCILDRQTFVHYIAKDFKRPDLVSSEDSIIINNIKFVVL